MSSAAPLVTIVIPTRPGQVDIPAVTAVRALEYPRDCLEVIVTRGRQPAVQRNTAVRAAKGEIIYFLDDDALPLPGNLRRVIAQFADPEVQMVGGPNVCPPEAPPLEQLFASVLGSWLAFGPSRARYAAVGKVRQTSEKELILCNLATRRSALVAAGGFDESLYPNEENALMDELQKRGGKLIYDPELLVYRRPRPTLVAFCKMLFTYGRGRAEQFRLHPTVGSALNVVPPLFVLYLLALPWANSLGWTQSAGRVDPALIWLALNLPLWLYLIALLAQAAASAGSHGFSRALSALPLVYASHMCYGLGFWRGLFTRLRRPEPSSGAAVALDYVAV